ncbi:MAG: IS3 family transposase [Deltaproteobacteria bacterium]|nr:IS3 family transposase [Deltaproteobacteria bacterium]
MSTRRRFSGDFKAKVALEALRGDKTIQEIAVRHKIHPNQVSTWKQRAVEGMKEVFSKGAERGRGEHEAEIRDLHAKIGELTVERDFLAKGLKVVSGEERRAMIKPGHPKLSLSRQCRLLRVSRSSVYHRPKGESAENLALMRRIDKLFLECPFYGSRHLWREGACVGRHRVRRLMRLMGLEAIYQAPRTTQPHPEHRVYPYRLKGVAIERPNHAWCADITYIPVQKGFLYLVAVMDWATRRVLSWRLSNTLDARFCTDALSEALQRYGRPEIFNSDQGSQFTSLEFTSVLKDSGVAISMDGRGRCMDNIFIERLWRSLKYEAVYLHEISDGFQAQRLISSWFAFYDRARPHSALGGSTPAEAYEKGILTQRPAQRRGAPASLPALPEQQDLLNRTLAA